MKTTPARLLTIALGVWLFLSAFIWPHTASQFSNAWISGLLIIAFAATAIRVDGARYGCTVLAIWLFFSNWVLPTENEATAWNNIIVSVAVFVASLATHRVITEEPGAPPTIRPPKHA
jgi:hypothetical protein